MAENVLDLRVKRADQEDWVRHRLSNMPLSQFTHFSGPGQDNRVKNSGLRLGNVFWIECKLRTPPLSVSWMTVTRSEWNVVRMHFAVFPRARLMLPAEEDWSSYISTTTTRFKFIVKPTKPVPAITSPKPAATGHTGSRIISLITSAYSTYD